MNFLFSRRNTVEDLIVVDYLILITLFGNKSYYLDFVLLFSSGYGLECGKVSKSIIHLLNFVTTFRNCFFVYLKTKIILKLINNIFNLLINWV